MDFKGSLKRIAVQQGISIEDFYRISEDANRYRKLKKLAQGCSDITIRRSGVYSEGNEEFYVRSIDSLSHYDKLSTQDRNTLSLDLEAFSFDDVIDKLP